MNAQTKERMDGYVVSFKEVDQRQIGRVGGKGANLGELARIDGLRVPDGFCVTTAAFERILAEAPLIGPGLDELSRLEPDNHETIRALSADIRKTIEGIAIPDDLETAILGALARLGEQAAYAVRSSATAEDLPAASFAGQQDTYLNVMGPAAVIQHVSRCWASLFTERAVTYRLRNRIDHHKVHMAVIVQRMVFPQAAGILFTADPITGNRKVSSVEASFGLGEALVSGRVNADVYKVRDGKIVARTVGTKQLAILASAAGGTREQAITPEQQAQFALTDAQIVRLAELGQRIEAHFGRPQDIEWCLADDDFQVVQSRPISTLFPIPERCDRENHVYLSVGHQQMMTDAMKPLGLSVWLLTALTPMYEAGGRLFVDITRHLGSAAGRAGLMGMAGKSDALTGDALQTVIDRGFIPLLPETAPSAPPVAGAPALIDTNPDIVTELIERDRNSLAALKREMASKSGTALFEFLMEAIEEHKRFLKDPRSTQVIMAVAEATWWLNERLEAWLGEKNVVGTLTQSVPHNVTSEMGLALLDVADVIRPHPDVVAFLQRVDDENFLDALPALAGGREARDALQAWLDQYGMRCPGEIDITRTRWSERPSMLLPLVLGNVRNFEPGAAARRFEQGRREAAKKEQEILERLRALPDGEQKAQETKRVIDRVRTFAGYREYPKYGIICRYFVYKQALMKEAERLVRAGVLREREDIFYFTIQELEEVVRTHQSDYEIVHQREAAFRSHQALRPPRVLTSEGEMLNGAYRRGDLPAGALVGLAVSSGIIEGRARVVLDMAEAELEPGDILVTAFTDPSWTPLFVTIAGLVTEVGGLMTHGAVIAREYGLPAVVGVEHATRLIRDGQRIRVNGTDGYVELLT